MSDINSSVTVTRNLLWRLFERIGAKGVEFLVSIVLARILAPEVYGEIVQLNCVTSGDTFSLSA